MKTTKIMFAAILTLSTAVWADAVGGWSQFKPGSFAKYKTTTAVAGTKMSSETKMTLVSMGGGKATVETEVTAMGTTTKNKAEVPLNAAAPAGNAQATPSKKGSETVTVNGKSFNCDTYEVDSAANGMKMHTKTWVSAQVPGGLVKSVSSSTGAAKSETTMELVDFKN